MPFLQILITSGLLIALSAYLLHQFLSRSLSEEDAVSQITPVETEMGEERLKAA